MNGRYAVYLETCYRDGGELVNVSRVWRLETAQQARDAVYALRGLWGWDADIWWETLG